MALADLPMISSDRIYHRDFVSLTRQGSTIRLHARREFYGRPRYDFVRVGNDREETWIGQVLLFFDVQAVGTAEIRQMALVHWLTEEADSLVLGGWTFHYHGTVDVIALSTILNRVRLAEVPGGDLDSGRRCFIVLPYGRANRQVIQDGEWVAM